MYFAGKTERREVLEFNYYFLTALPAKYFLLMFEFLFLRGVRFEFSLLTGFGDSKFEIFKSILPPQINHHAKSFLH
jgi:hypothetical protein